MTVSDSNSSPTRAGAVLARNTMGLRLGAWFRSLLARPRLSLNALLLLVFSAAWIREVLYWFARDAAGTGLDYWAYTDWLIDYSQGFIRRGLSGEMWRLVPASVPPMLFVAVLSWALILAAAIGYLWMLARLWKTLHPLTLFGLLFLPSLFFFYLHDHGALARKEILGYATVLLHLLIVEKTLPGGNLRRYVGWLIPLTVVLLPAILLVHEGNFLLFVPLHALITLAVLRMNSSQRFTRAALWTGLLYLPATITFIGVYLAGTPGHAQLLGICEKWLAAGALRESSCILPPDRLSGSTLPGSFIPMEWSLPKAMSITAMIISLNWKAWVTILPVLGVSLWYLSRQALYALLRARASESFSVREAQRFTNRFFWVYFLIPFLCSLPIYLTAYDYGRWLTVTSINFCMVLVSQELPGREFARLKTEADEGSAPAPEHLDTGWVFYGVSGLICVLALVLWLPHYCLFECKIVQGPLQFLAHTLTAR